MANSIDKFQLQGEVRHMAMEQFTRQLSLWELSMPQVEPLVLDFGLGDFARTGLIEYWIANEMQAGYCGKYLFVADGQSCPAHSHSQKHETFFVVKGTAVITVNGQRRILGAGASLAMPPGHIHSFTGQGPALLLELSTPCIVNDNRFENPEIAAWLRASVE